MIDTGSTGGAVRLRPPRHRVSRRALPWWGCRAVGEVLVVLAGMLLAAWWFSLWRELFLPLLVVAVLGCCYVVVMPWWRYRVHRWETTESAVYTASGWISREWRVAPMSRIQTVDTARGPLQRVFGLSSVTVTTASAAGPLSIDGLDHRVAAELAELLTRTTQATPGDAT